MAVPYCRPPERTACSRGCRISGPGRNGTMAANDNEKSRLDEAARAGWLYFIAGHTQDEIAKMLQVSRASAQRLVSLCLAERLITFRLEHPIASCMELAARLKEPVRSGALRGGADRSRIAFSQCGNRRALRQSAGNHAARGEACDHRARHRARGACCGRAGVADRSPGASDRLAGRQHPGRRLGELLRHGRPARRPHRRASLSDAAAVPDGL